METTDVNLTTGIAFVPDPPDIAVNEVWYTKEVGMNQLETAVIAEITQKTVLLKFKYEDDLACFGRFKISDIEFVERLMAVCDESDREDNSNNT